MSLFMFVKELYQVAMADVVQDVEGVADAVDGLVGLFQAGSRLRCS